MKNPQQQIALTMLGLLIGGGLLVLMDQSLVDTVIKPLDILYTTVSLCVLILLWFLCWYQWQRGRYVVILAMVLVIVLNRTEPYITKQISLDTFVPVVIAMLLGGLWWVVGTAIITYILLLILARGDGVYAQLETMTAYGIVVGGIILARYVTNAAQRAAEANAKDAGRHAQALAETNDQLRRRDAIMEAVGFAAQQFLEATEWDQQIMPVLERLTSVAQVSRVAIFENRCDEKGALYAIQRHVWNTDDTTVLLETIAQQAFDYAAVGLSRWVTLLGQDMAIYGPQSRFRLTEREWLATQGILSTAVIPIFVQHTWWGFMRCDACVAERTWLAAEIEALKVATGILGTAIHRDNSEMALRKSEATNRALLDALPDVMFRTTRSGILRDVKAGKTDDVFVIPATLIGRQVAEILPPDVAQTVLFHNEQALRTGEIQVFECTLPLRNELREYEARMVVCGEDEVLSIVRDITERKKVDRMKTEFISVVSHELRTPLTSIRGALGLVTNGVAGEVPPQARAMLDIASKNSERLVRLINDMLDIEKIESGKMVFNFRPLAIVPLVEQAVETNLAYAAQFEVALAFEHNVRDVLVYGDGDRLIQVFTNLISNAAKFSPPGSTIRVTANKHNAGVRVAVSDSGPGIGEAFRDSIFERFTQADSSDTRQKEGTGLGLSIAKSIVEKHSGQIGFTTELGVGTTFFVDLAEWHTTPSPSIGLPTHDHSLLPSDQPCILICEDDHDVASLLKIMLTQAGFNADIAYNAAQVRQSLARTHYDGMTLDLMLPDQDGIALIRELRSQPATEHLPIIVVSARADEERTALNGDALEIVDWLNKPIQHDRLIAAVERATHMHIDGKPRILHIEDDHDVVKVVTGILEDVADVVWAASLHEATERLAQGPFNLVLIDLSLPDGSGLDVIPLLNRQILPIPVVIFSAQEFQRETAYTIAATLIKSRTSNQTLLRTITSLIGRNQSLVTSLHTGASADS